MEKIFEKKKLFHFFQKDSIISMCINIYMYRDEKTQGIQRMILFVEVFAIFKCFGFKTFIRASKLKRSKC